MKRREDNSDMRTQILRRRYLWKDAHGKVIETPEQMFRRVADAIAASESKYGATDSEQKAIADEFYELMVNGAFLPNSPTLMNAGRDNEMLSACFVLSVEDSIEAIFDAVKYAALNKDIDVLSCPDAIARAIEEAMGEDRDLVTISFVDRCPDCDYPLRKDSGCRVCDRCAYDKCG